MSDDKKFDAEDLDFAQVTAERLAAELANLGILGVTAPQAVEIIRETLLTTGPDRPDRDRGH